MYFPTAVVDALRVDWALKFAVLRPSNYKTSLIQRAMVPEDFLYRLINDTNKRFG